MTGLSPFNSLKLLLGVWWNTLLGLLFGQLARLSLVLDSFVSQHAVLHLLRNVHIHFALVEQVLLFLQQRLCILRDLGRHILT